MVLPTPEQVGAHPRAADPTFGLRRPAAFAGLRLGEAAAVQVGDVDSCGEGSRFSDRFSARARASGDPGAEVRERARRVPGRRAGDDAGPRVRARRRDADRWLFVGDGQPTASEHGRLPVAKTLQAAGVTGVTLHDLRHFYASGLIAAGCDVVTVQRALGHAKATTTLNTYAHLWPTAEDRTRRRPRTC